MGLPYTLLAPPNLIRNGGIVMRRIVIAALVCTSINGGHASAQSFTPANEQPAATPPAAPAKPLSTCEGLARDWRSAEIELAEHNAEGLADNSAPRATMRAVEDQNALLKAQIALTLMQSHKCSLPRRAPSWITYSLNALKCSTEKLKGNYKSPECDSSTWTPLGQ